VRHPHASAGEVEFARRSPIGHGRARWRSARTRLRYSRCGDRRLRLARSRWGKLTEGRGRSVLVAARCRWALRQAQRACLRGAGGAAGAASGMRPLPLRAPGRSSGGKVCDRAGAGPRLERQAARRRRRRRRWQSPGGPTSDFRYEIRLWRGGHIPDVAEAVDSPRRLTDDEVRARRVLDLVAEVPTPVWGRDERAAGEMWNSNSVIAWVIARSGIDTESVKPPLGGRAPGWQAGLVVAGRQDEEAAPTMVDGAVGSRFS
jgi:hypothetical protein